MPDAKPGYWKRVPLQLNCQLVRPIDQNEEDGTEILIAFAFAPSIGGRGGRETTDSKSAHILL